ncbi:MAG: tyrosine-type recombinase/integrase [bacterium]
MSKKLEKFNHKNGDKIIMKSNLDNEKIKNKYFDYLKESEGYAEATITAHKKAIFRYEEFSNFEDFKNFNKKRAIEYKKWLEEKIDPRTSNKISLTTVYHYIRNLREFFEWLAIQPTYKSKILLTDVDYLKLPKKQARIATSSKREDFPTIEQIKKAVESIKINSEIDLRDKALLSFTLSSGMRDKAIITLPIGCFVKDRMQINQDPKFGVQTKFSKTILSYLFRFDEDMVKYFLDWYEYLRTDKFFGNADPIFPKNKVINAENSLSFISNEVEPKFWQSATSIRDIFKQRFEKAGIKYFSPHTFRHTAILTALSKCRNGQEIKAISQNFGHENVSTTLTAYGTLNQTQMHETISGMCFSEDSDNFDDLAQQIQEILRKKQKGNF